MQQRQKTQARFAAKPFSRAWAAPLALSAAFLGLAFPPAPAQASEVVKLARLVVTGKRLSSAPVVRAPAKQLPKVVVEGQATPEEMRMADLRRAQFRPI